MVLICPSEISSLVNEKAATVPAPRPEYSFNNLSLGPPIATLRALGELSETRTVRRPVHSNGQNDTLATKMSAPYAQFDPVTCGLITESEASRAVAMYAGKMFAELKL